MIPDFFRGKRIPMILKAVIIVIYDTLCDARSEGVDWWERDELAEQELRSKMFGNN